MRTSPIILLVTTVLLAACTSSTDATSSDATGPNTSVPAPPSVVDIRGGIPLGYPLDVDLVAPLVMTTLAPDPIPVTGTDGRIHVAYELSVLNAGPRAVTITQVQTLADGPAGAVVNTVGQKDVVARTILIPNYGSTPVTEIPAGRTAVLVLDDVYDTRVEIPVSVTHRLTATLGAAAPGNEAVAARYPDSVTQVGGTVRTSTESPMVIGPPLAGDHWAALNGCCGITSHRGAVMPVAGRLNGSERYAIDWVRVDPASDPLSTFTGDGRRNVDYRAYDAPLLAVADGTITAVVSDMKEATPQVITPNLSFSQLAGNHIILDVGGGNFALYAHMIPGSATVKVGDEVVRGQVIGQLGNSGNTSEAHLHFHVSRASVPLSSDNVPYEIDRFAFAGSIEGDRVVPAPNVGERTDQLPLDGSVVDFPAAP